MSKLNITKDLDPRFKEPLLKTIDDTKSEGFEFRVYNGVRDVWTQAKYWRQSRTTEQINNAIEMLASNNAPFLANVLKSVGPQYGPRVTGALPGFSWHQWTAAADLFLVENGKAVWDSHHPGYRALATTAVDNGLVSGYFWRMRDAVHLQLFEEKVRQLHTVEVVDEWMQKIWSIAK